MAMSIRKFPFHDVGLKPLKPISVKTLDSLHNIERVIFVITDHTLQKDLVKPYVPWKLGPLSKETCLTEDFNKKEAYAKGDISRRKGEMVDNVDLQIELMSIHDRNREILPPGKLRRPIQGWEMDWFG